MSVDWTQPTGNQFAESEPWDTVAEVQAAWTEQLLHIKHSAEPHGNKGSKTPVSSLLSAHNSNDYFLLNKEETLAKAYFKQKRTT